MRMLFAGCPRRAQLLCEKLFEVDASGIAFEYFDDVEERLILQLMASVPSLPDHLQPRKLCSPLTWKLLRASAHAKTRDKPDSRVPSLTDRGARRHASSAWPPELLAGSLLCSCHGTSTSICTGRTGLCLYCTNSRNQSIMARSNCPAWIFIVVFAFV